MISTILPVHDAERVDERGAGGAGFAAGANNFPVTGALVGGGGARIRAGIAPEGLRPAGDTCSKGESAMYEHRIVTVSSRRLDKQLGEPERAALFEISHGLSYGLQRIWNGECEVFTASGLLEIAQEFEARGMVTGATIVRAEIAGLRVNAALPAPVSSPDSIPARRHRAHIPYVDPDDETIFSAHEGDHSHAARRH